MKTRIPRGFPTCFRLGHPTIHMEMPFPSEFQWTIELHSQGPMQSATSPFAGMNEMPFTSHCFLR
jgi:hypothetical protein